jgi:hypothetical protein
MNVLAHIVAQHLNVPLLKAVPPKGDPATGPSPYVAKYGPRISELKAEGLSNREIARELDLPYGSVASVYSRWVKA